MNLLYLFIGDSEYLINERINALLKKINVDEFNTITYDMEENDLSSLVEEATTIPFMAEQKVIIVKNAAQLMKTKDLIELINYLKKPSDTSIIIFDGLNMILDSSSELAKVFKLSAEIKEVKECTNFTEYIKKKIDESGSAIDDEAINALLERTNTREALDQEIDKLMMFSNGGIIKKNDIDILVSRNLEDNVFELVNAVILKNKKEIIRIYRDLLTNGEDDIRIMNVIVNKYNEILSTKLLLEQKFSKEDIAQYFHVSQGRAFYMVKNANDVSLVNVKKALSALAELDYKIKSGLIDKRTGLELLLFKLGE